MIDATDRILDNDGVVSARSRRDSIRRALEVADMREDMELIDRSRAMKLERIRKNKELADQADSMSDNNNDAAEQNQKPIKSVDFVIKIGVFSLATLFVGLMFRFLFYPIVTM